DLHAVGHNIASKRDKRTAAQRSDIETGFTRDSNATRVPCNTGFTPYVATQIRRTGFFPQPSTRFLSNLGQWRRAGLHGTGQHRRSAGAHEYIRSIAARQRARWRGPPAYL